VNDLGEYAPPLTSPLPRGTEQTEAILSIGRTALGLDFVVEHNGLGPAPQDHIPAKDNCPNQGEHPATPPFGGIGTGCPNRWVLEQGAAGQVTGFQTNNSDGVKSMAELESSLQNAWDNSDGIFVEIYEARLWDAENNGPVLNPNASGRTLKQWNDLFLQRRRDFWGDKITDPFPLSFRHVFTRKGFGSAEQRIYYYTDPSSCREGNKNSFGAIILLPDGDGAINNPDNPNESLNILGSKIKFFPSTASIQYFLPSSGDVQLDLFDIKGQKIGALVNEWQQAGIHSVTWDGKSRQNGLIKPGIYFVRLINDNNQITMKMIFLCPL
jgi:hypothetical protein